MIWGKVSFYEPGDIALMRMELWIIDCHSRGLVPLISSKSSLKYEETQKNALNFDDSHTIKQTRTQT